MWQTNQLSIMNGISAEEVLRAVSNDLKRQHITHVEAAKALGFSTRQTLSNLLSSKKYLSAKQAEKFHRVFGYNQEFLIYGTGTLKGEDSGYEDKDLEEILKKVTKKGDMQLILSWFLEAFSRRRDNLGLALWAEVSHYVQEREQLLKDLRSWPREDRPPFSPKCYELFDAIEEQAREKVQKILDEMKEG